MAQRTPFSIYPEEHELALLRVIASEKGRKVAPHIMKVLRGYMRKYQEKRYGAQKASRVRQEVSRGGNTRNGIRTQDAPRRSKEPQAFVRTVGEVDSSIPVIAGWPFGYQPSGGAVVVAP